MKKISALVLLLLIIFLGWYIYSVSTNRIEKNKVGLSAPENLQNEDIVIESIQKKVKSIDDEKDYQVKTLDNEWFVARNIVRDNGVIIDGYVKDGQISKITEKIGLSYGVRIYEYYLVDKKLIYVNEKEDYYPYDNDSSTFNYAKLESGFEAHHYFHENKLVQTKISGEKKFPENDVNLESLFTSTATEYVDLLTNI